MSNVRLHTHYIKILEMITKLNPDVIQDGSITAEKLADGIANDIISSLSTQSTLPSLTDYYIGQNAGGHTETYFKKTLQSIGSVFQHELYDKVYLKDGSDPTFGNITAWQLNLSENSYVTHADGFGLALSVNDCAFLVGEEGGVYYLDDAGNTQTMLHSGNIGDYKLSQFTDDVVAGKYLPLSKFQVAEVADPSTVYLQSGIYRQSDGSHLAVGTSGWSQFITLHAGGDNWAQMYFSYDGRLHYRAATFGDGDPANIPWKAIITEKNISSYALPLSGGTIRNDNDTVPLTLDSSKETYTGIGFINKNDEKGYLLYTGGSNYGVTAANWSATYTLMHSGNIGNYNAGSATKLQTPRTLWGQSFDGTNSISGTLHIGGDLENAAGGIYIHQTNEINSFNGNLYLNHRGSGLSSYGSTNDIVMVANGGKVGIGTNEAEERLDVVGNIKASGNIICSNLVTTGMINQTANNSFIVHNAVSNGDHKMWITDGTGKSISAGSAFASDALNIISDTLLVLVAQYDYDIRVLKGSRTAKVIDSINYSTLLPYKTPVAISNTYSSDPHNVAMADNTLYIVYENEADDHGCTILSFPTNDGSTPLTCGLLYTTYADSTGEFSCPTVIWSYNITPLMEPDATFEMWFTSYDGGTTWYGTHTVYK